MVMRTRIGVVFVVALVAAVAGALIVRQEQALGQAEKAPQLDKKSPIFRPDTPRPAFPVLQPQRWEYRVLSLNDKDDAANEDLARLTSDGWDYAGVIQSALPPARATAQLVQNFRGTPTRVLFKRLMKKPVDRAEQPKP
jgi:hypothetical protein